MKIASLFAAAAVCAVAACSPDKTPAPQPAAQAAPAAPAPTVLDDQMRAMQKARDVQKTMDQRAPDVDKQVKDSGG
jgi:hypothetical protein